jgi:lipopolysaccharide biosynthesis glycosyltransferase
MRHLNGRVDPHVFYARLLLWTDYFRDFGNILHLDVDTLILDPLEDLVAVDEFVMVLEEHTEPDYLFLDHRDPALLTLLEEDSIKIDAHRGNAGVFLLPPQWRGAQEYREILRLLSRYREHLKWADQSLLNLWMLHRGIETSWNSSWNYQLRAHGEKILLPNKPRVLHLNGIPYGPREILMKLGWEMLVRGESSEQIAQHLFELQSTFEWSSMLAA